MSRLDLSRLDLPFDTQPAPSALFRMGRKPRAWAWTDLRYAGQGRWDDPKHLYAVLYTSRNAFGAYLESLSQFQPDLELVDQLRRIRKNAAGLRATSPAGRVPANWRSLHVLGRGAPDRVGEPFVAVGRAGTLAVIRRELASVARGLEIEDIDAGVIRLDYSEKFREFTKAVSRFLYEQPQPYAGIFYLGQHGDDVENYAIFQRGADCPVADRGQREIGLDDQDFLRACRLLNIEPA